MLAPSPEDADHDLLYKGLPLCLHQPTINSLLRRTKTRVDVDVDDEDAKICFC